MPLPVTGSAAAAEVPDASPSPPGTPGPAGPPVGTRVVDLSLLVAEELPCTWSTHMPFQQKTFTYVTAWLSVGVVVGCLQGIATFFLPAIRPGQELESIAT